IDIKDDVNMRKFVKLVDDVSWQEFMPEGVSKELFLRFSKYYDQDVFIEAGRIIRRRVKKLDSLDPLERANELALIFNTFRNRSEEHTSELQSRFDLVCRLLLEKKKKQ